MHPTFYPSHIISIFDEEPFWNNALVSMDKSINTNNISSPKTIKWIYMATAIPENYIIYCLPHNSEKKLLKRKYEEYSFIKEETNFYFVYDF